MLEDFLDFIERVKVRINSFIIGKYVLFMLSLFILLFFIYLGLSLTGMPALALYFSSLTLKMFMGLVVLYLALEAKNALLDRRKTAKLLDTFFQDKHETLLNALELASEKHPLSGVITQQANTYVQDKQMKFRISFRHFYLPLALVTSLVLGFFIDRPLFYGAMQDYLRPRYPHAVHKSAINVSPGNISLKRGSNLMIKVIEPDNCAHKLYLKRENVWREISLKNEQAEFNALDYSFKYYLQTPYAVSDTFAVDIYDLPFVTELTAKIEPPVYSGIKPYTKENSDGNITALKGAIISLTLTANNDLTKAEMLFSKRSPLQMERIGKKTFEVRFPLLEEQTYYFALTDFLGNTSEKIEKFLILAPDNPPEVDIVYPGVDTLLAQNMLQKITVSASDDYNLRNLYVYWSINGKEESSATVREIFPSPLITCDYVLSFAGYGLFPGDEVSYYASIEDNLRQKAVSRRYFLRFPSLEEIYKQIEQEEAKRDDILQTQREKAQELKKEADKVQRELYKKPEASWQDKKNIEKLMQNQEDLTKNIEKAAENYQDLIKNMENNSGLSEKTLEKMNKIKELMEQINTPSLQEAMQKMQEQLKNTDAEALKKAMENFRFSLDDFVQKLDQTISLLESIKKEQALDKAAEMAKELEKMQQQAGEENNLKSAAEKQNKVNENFAAFQKELQKADSLLTKNDGQVKEEMEKLKQEIQEDNLSQDLTQAMQNLQQSKSAKAQQQQALKKMRKMSGRLQKMSSMLAAQGGEELQQVLDETITAFLYFTAMQKKSAASFQNDPFAILPEQLAVYEGMDITLSNLYAQPQILMVLNQKFFIDSNFTYSTFKEMFSDINEAKTYTVKGHLSSITKGLNMMIFDLMQAQSNMQNGGSGNSSSMQQLMQSLQNMGQQQMMLNMLTGQLMEELNQNGNKMSNALRQKMQRLANDEEQLADNLNRLMQENSAAQNQASALKQLESDLREIARNLRAGRLDRSIIDKQERILSRLLDAQKSVNQRDFSKKREAESGENKTWQIPADVRRNFEDARKKALLMEESKKYSPELREVIREYLKRYNEKAR